MTENSFRLNVQEIEKLYGELELIKKVNYANTQQTSYKKYSSEFVNIARENDYFLSYRCALENDDYDYLLHDGSFFQFSFDMINEHEVIRLAYYPSVCSIKYEDFLLEQFNTTEEEVGSLFIEEYQHYLIDQTPENVTPVRYDYDESLYDEVIHSAAHIHCGYEENIRIPIGVRIKPLLFSKIIIEYFYYKIWKKYIVVLKDKKLLFNNSDMEVLDRSFFSDKDHKVPFIHLDKTMINIDL